MKVDNNNSLRITGRISNAVIIRNLDEGSTVSAKIIKRLGPRNAIVDISGSRVKAEFLKGVPLNSSISLLLDNKTEGAVFFKIVYDSKMEDSFGKLLEHTVFNPAEFKNNDLGKLSMYINKELSDLFMYNCFLLRLKGYRENYKEGMTTILNRLLKLGINKEALFFLSFILNTSLKNEQLYSLMMLFAHSLKSQYDFGKSSKNDNDSQKKLKEIFEGIEKLGTSEKLEMINKILDLLNKENYSEASISSGEIPYFDNDIFKPMRYIINKNLAFFSFYLTYLEKIDVLINNGGSGLNISIFCGKDSSLQALKKDFSQLKYGLERQFNKFNVFFYCIRDVIEKIIEINASLSFNTQVDLKV